MSNPPAPRIPKPSDPPAPPVSPGTVSDPDAFGPDVPNVREEDPKTTHSEPIAPPPGPPTASPDELDFAPDEA